MLDESNYLKAMRLFKADVNWTPINRGPDGDKHHVRLEYLKGLADENEDEEDEPTNGLLKKRLIA
jgi:cupin superfamily acireductone dioxygenase involved in methionine salvage